MPLLRGSSAAIVPVMATRCIPSYPTHAIDPVARLPKHASGMRIGLMGGSFNPPHAGHRLAALTALRRLQLDRVWWLVTPGNPLKHHGNLEPLGLRMRAAVELAKHPRIDVTGVEAVIGTRYTYDTIRYLRVRCPGVRFVWIMGSDNLLEFDHWQRWRDIAALVPLAVVDRPGSTLRATHSRAARTLARFRLDESDAALLPGHTAPAMVFLHDRRSPLSSSALRGEAQPERLRVAAKPNVEVSVGNAREG